MAASIPAIGSSVGSALTSFGLERSQRKIEQEGAEIASQQQELQVKQREADRKDRLASSLATQIASSAASGVSAFEGSPLRVLEDSIEREELATKRDVFGTELGVMAIRSTARARANMQRIQSGLNLANSLTETVKSAGGIPGG